MRNLLRTCDELTWSVSGVSRLGVEGVVPLAVELVTCEDALCFKGFDLLVGDLDALRVLGVVEFGADGESGPGGGRGDGLYDHLVAGQWPAAPVHRDVGEQPVFDLVKAPG